MEGCKIALMSRPPCIRVAHHTDPVGACDSPLEVSASTISDGFGVDWSHMAADPGGNEPAIVAPGRYAAFGAERGMRNRWPLASNTKCCRREQTATYSNVSCRNIRRLARGVELEIMHLRPIEPLPTNQEAGSSNLSGRRATPTVSREARACERRSLLSWAAGVLAACSSIGRMSALNSVKATCRMVTAILKEDCIYVQSL